EVWLGRTYVAWPIAAVGRSRGRRAASPADVFRFCRGVPVLRAAFRSWRARLLDRRVHAELRRGGADRGCVLSRWDRADVAGCPVAMGALRLDRAGGARSCTRLSLLAQSVVRARPGVPSRRGARIRRAVGLTRMMC